MTDTADTLNSLLAARHSCRAFLPDQVPVDTIRDVIRMAGRAPSWCNAQPWQALITQGPETDRFRTGLQDAVKAGPPAPDLPWPEAYPGVHGDRRRTCGYQLYEAVGIARADRAGRAAQSARNFALFDAPHVAILHSEAALGPYGALDCGGFLMTFLLAAEAHGLGTIAQASVAAYPNFIRAHFGLPDTRHILCAISFGYPDPDHPANQFRTERAALDDILDLRG